MPDECEFLLTRELLTLYDAKDYAEAIRLCNWYLHALRRYKWERHIAYTFKALCQLDRKQYGYAVKNSRKGLALYPSCTWARFVHLRCLEALGINMRTSGAVEEAIALGHLILNDGVRAMQKDECTKDLDPKVHISYLNDTKFLLAFLEDFRSNSALACKLLQDFIAGHDQDESFFTVGEATEELARMTSPVIVGDRS